MSTQPATVIPASLSPLEQPKPTHNGSLSPATSAAQRRRKKKNRTKTVIGGLLLLPIGYVYGKLVMVMPDASGEVAYTARVFPQPVSFFTGWMRERRNVMSCGLPAL